MRLTRVSDIKPGDKFNIDGEELFVSYIYYTGEEVRIDFENAVTIGNPFLTSVKTSRYYHLDSTVEVK